VVIKTLDPELDPDPQLEKMLDPYPDPQPWLKMPPACIRSKKPALFGREGEKRRVVVPESLMNKFLAVASANSANNIETLGTLGGKLSNNR
jgi:hypothetical protein